MTVAWDCDGVPLEECYAVMGGPGAWRDRLEASGADTVVVLRETVMVRDGGPDALLVLAVLVFGLVGGWLSRHYWGS